MRTPGRILSGRWLVAVALGCASACSHGSAERSRIDGKLDEAGLPIVNVHVDVSAEHARDAARVLAAAVATLRRAGEWLGPYKGSSLEIVEADRAVAAAPSTVVIPPQPWLSRPESMGIELAAARAASGQYWRQQLDAANLPSWFIAALVELVARRTVEPMFQVDNLAPGYAFMEARFFGGFVPKFLRIRLATETDGVPPSAYRSNPHVAPVVRPTSRDDARALEAKAFLTLGTLDRWVGRPVFDEILTRFVHDSTGRQPALADFARTASEVSGQDLSWLFDQTLASTGIFDYAVAELTSEPASGGFSTTVVVRRNGAAQFTGAARQPIGSFESGQGVALLVEFADGRRRVDHWDGRAKSREFAYRSPARAVSAEVDPDGVILLDLNRTNNSRALRPFAGRAAVQWAARWLAWLQDGILTWASLV